MSNSKPSPGELKYDADMYVDSGFMGGDMDDEYERINESLVRCRKEHECVGAMKCCKKVIKPGDYAVRVTALFPGEGFKSAYICTSCIEAWLEESGQVEESEDLNDESQ